MQAAVLALAAGNDLILLSNGDPLYEGKAISAIQLAVRSGKIDRRKLHESALRVNQLRDKWGVPLTPSPNLQLENLAATHRPDRLF